jgi:hypothetical protein
MLVLIGVEQLPSSAPPGVKIAKAKWSHPYALFDNYRGPDLSLGVQQSYGDSTLLNNYLIQLDSQKFIQKSLDGDCN